jgi:hypothetical protein
LRRVALLCGVFVHLHLALFPAGGPFLPSLSVNIILQRETEEKARQPETKLSVNIIFNWLCGSLGRCSQHSQVHMSLHRWKVRRHACLALALLTC